MAMSASNGNGQVVMPDLSSNGLGSAKAATHRKDKSVGSEVRAPQVSRSRSLSSVGLRKAPSEPSLSSLSRSPSEATESRSASDSQVPIFRLADYTVEEIAEQRKYGLTADEVHVLHENEEAFSFALATDPDTLSGADSSKLTAESKEKDAKASKKEANPTFLVCHELFMSMTQGFDYLHKNQEKHGFSSDTFAYTDKITKESEFKAALMQPEERKGSQDKSKPTKALVKVSYEGSRAWFPLCFQHDNKLSEDEKQRKGLSLYKTINMAIAKGAKEVCLYFGELEPGSKANPHEEMDKWMRSFSRFIPKNTDPESPVVKFVCRDTWTPNPSCKDHIYLVEHWQKSAAYKKATQVIQELFFDRRNKGRYKSAICVDAADFRERKLKQLLAEREAESREVEYDSPRLKSAGKSQPPSPEKTQLTGTALVHQKLKASSRPGSASSQTNKTAPEEKETDKHDLAETDEDELRRAVEDADATEKQHSEKLLKLGKTALKHKNRLLGNGNGADLKALGDARRGSGSGLFESDAATVRDRTKERDLTAAQSQQPIRSPAPLIRSRSPVRNVG